jgi:hypothetical protein
MLSSKVLFLKENIYDIKHFKAKKKCGEKRNKPMCVYLKFMGEIHVIPSTIYLTEFH